MINDNNNQIYIYLDIKMIKLKIMQGDRKQKVLINLQTYKQKTVKQFLDKVISICQLQNVLSDDLQMYHKQFLLPHKLSSQCIKQKKVYIINVKNKSNKQNTSQQLYKKISENEQKQKKIQKLVSQQSDSSSQQIQIKKKLPIKNTISNKKVLNKQQKNKQPQQNNLHSKKTLITKKIEHKKQILQNKQLKLNKLSSSSDQSSSLQPVTKVINNQINSKQPIPPKTNQPIKNNPPIHQPSQSSSQQSSVKSVQYATKVKQILQHVNNESRKNNEIRQTQKNKNSIIKPKIIPITIRKQNHQFNKPKLTNTSNKQTHNSFKQHQQQKWISITKQIINQWKISNTQISLIQPNNEIRFKIVQLDQDKFIPVNSGWIIGYVSQIQKIQQGNLILKFINANKHAKDGLGQSQYIGKYEISMYNMQELQINKNTLNEDQKTILPKTQLQQQKKVEQLQKQQGISTLTKNQEIIQKEQQKYKVVQNIEQYICGQINYYFSDKNYLTDLFMQMHANQDIHKCIPIKLLLNFPKIKKILANEQKLWQYLTSDQKYPNRTYELDHQRKMIKKKQQ